MPKKAAPRSNPWILAILLRSVRTHLMSQRHIQADFVHLLNEKDIPRLKEKVRAGLEVALSNTNLRQVFDHAVDEGLLADDFEGRARSLVQVLHEVQPQDLGKLDRRVSKMLKDFEATLKHINKNYRGVPIWQAAHALEAALIEARPVHFTDSKVSEFETNRRVIDYQELQVYASMIGIPVGVLLAMSRVSAEIRDSSEKGLAELDAIIDGLRAMCEFLAEPSTRQRLATQDFHAIAAEDTLHPYDPETLASLFQSLLATYRRSAKEAAEG